MIKSIRLLNWRSHADTKLEFRKGTNLLVGIMGAGKSSVIEGISFALYGTFPAMERRKIKLDNVVRLNEEKASVILEFEWDGLLYRVERVIERSKKGTSTQAELFKNNALLEHGQYAVTSHIQALSGVDYDLFTRAIYSEQNNIDHFLNLDPRRRKEELDALLGLDRFETARASAISVINRIRSKREGIEQRFNKERLDELTRKESETAAAAAALEASLAKLSVLEAELASKHLEAAKKYDEMKKSRETFERLEKETLKLTVLIDSLSKELSGISLDQSQVKAAEERLSGLNETRSKLQERLKLAESRVSQYSKETGLIEARIRQSEENVSLSAQLKSELEALLRPRNAAELMETQKSLGERLLNTESELLSIRSQIHEITDSASRLKKGLSECPVCASPLGDDAIEHIRKEKNKLLSEKNSRREALESALSMLKKGSEELSALIRKTSSIEEKMKILAKDAHEPSALAKKRLELDAEIKKAEEERKALRDEANQSIQESERLRSGISNLKALSSKAKTLEEARNSLSKNKSDLASVRFSPEEFEKSRNESERLNIEVEKIRSETKSTHLQLKLSRDLHLETSKELHLLRQIETDSRELYALEEQLSVFKNALMEAQTGLRGALSEAINNTMNEVWSIFYPYRNYHGLRLLVSEKDYLFEVNDGAGWKSLESTASGGERACAALALRMSLAMVLTPKLSWLILDEPTHNLDSQAVELLSHALQFKVPEVVRQTFVITHDEAFMGSDFASSFRILREKDQNGASRAEPA
jgi:exonuclease SbcC